MYTSQPQLPMCHASTNARFISRCGWELCTQNYSKIYYRQIVCHVVETLYMKKTSSFRSKMFEFCWLLGKVIWCCSDSNVVKLHEENRKNIKIFLFIPTNLQNYSVMWAENFHDFSVWRSNLVIGAGECKNRSSMVVSGGTEVKAAWCKLVEIVGIWIVFGGTN